MPASPGLSPTHVVGHYEDDVGLFPRSIVGLQQGQRGRQQGGEGKEGSVVEMKPGVVAPLHH